MTTPIEPRLILEPYSARHRRAFLALVGDPEVMARMDGILDSEAAAGLFQRLLRDDPKILLSRAAMLEGDYAGHGFLVRGEGGVELGFSLRRALWGRGLGRELAGALLTEARALGLSALRASVDIDNTASIRILERAGFRLLRRVREEPTDFLIYSLDLKP